MSNDHSDSRRTPLHAGVLVLLLLGLAAALAGNVYQFVKSRHTARDVALIQHSLQVQITRLSDATSGAFDVTQHRFEDLKKLQDATLDALIDARTDFRRNSSQVASRLEKRNQELAQKNRELTAQLAALKQDINARLQNTTARLQSTSTRLDTANAKLQHVSTETESNRADLKRVTGDLSRMTANLASSAKPAAAPTTQPQPLPQPAVPRPQPAAGQPPPAAAGHPPAAASGQPPAKKYFPFDLLKTKVPTTIDQIQVAILSTDQKNNRYTMDLYAANKIERRMNCAVNQTVQFYVSGSPLPYEIVVNQVQKDEVIGYVSVPHVSRPRIQTAAATVRGKATPGATRQ